MWSDMLWFWFAFPQSLLLLSFYFFLYVTSDLHVFFGDCLFKTFIHFKIGLGLPWWLSGKASTCQCRRHGFSQSLIWEDSTCRGTARPGTTATEPVLWRPVSRLLKRSTLEPCSTARDATTERSSHVVTREEPLFVTTREKPAKQRRPSTVKNK